MTYQVLGNVHSLIGEEEVQIGYFPLRVGHIILVPQ